MHPTDRRFDEFQALSDRDGMLIAVGAPTKGTKGNEISMICFQPGLARRTYSKQHLHVDEYPFLRPALNSSYLDTQIMSWHPPSATSRCRQAMQNTPQSQALTCIWRAWPSLREASHRPTVIIR